MKHGHDRNHLNSEPDTISDESARFHAWLTITIYLETILMNSSESTHLCFKMKWSWPTNMESLIDIEDFPGRSVRRSCLAPKSVHIHTQLMLKDFVTIQVQSPISKDLDLEWLYSALSPTMSNSSSMLQCSRLLHQAALWDNAELLEDLLNGEELEFINSCDSWGRSPVHAAATTESSHCLRQVVTMSEI